MGIHITNWGSECGWGESKYNQTPNMIFKAGLHYGGEGFRSVKNVWPRHGYMRQMVDVPEKNQRQ